MTYMNAHLHNLIRQHMDDMAERETKYVEQEKKIEKLENRIKKLKKKKK